MSFGAARRARAGLAAHLALALAVVALVGQAPVAAAAIPRGPGPATASREHAVAPSRSATHALPSAPQPGIALRTRAERLGGTSRVDVRTANRPASTPRLVPGKPAAPLTRDWTGRARSGDPAPDAGALATAPDVPRPESTASPSTASPLAAGAAAYAGGPGVVGPAFWGLDDRVDAALYACGNSRPCIEPPDPWIAVGPAHVVQAVNSWVRITDRRGVQLASLSIVDFFDIAGPTLEPGLSPSDPRVLYDPVRDRWIATLFAHRCAPSGQVAGRLLVAVSTAGDPTGAWTVRSIPFVDAWPDFPTLGISGDKVVVGANEFSVACTNGAPAGSFRGASLHVIDWDALLGAGDVAVTASTPDPALFTFVPATVLARKDDPTSQADDVRAVVAVGAKDPVTGADVDDVGVTVVTGTNAGHDVAVGAVVDLTQSATRPVARLVQPPTPRDAGGRIGELSNALDDRITDAVWRDGRLAFATNACSTITCATARPRGRIVELDTTTSPPSLRQDLAVSPTSGYTDTFMPGVGYSDDGTLWTVFSQSASTTYVSAWARRQVASDPPGAWSAGAALVAAGRGPYGGSAGAGLNQRWGDYVGIARDPLEPASVWQADEVADTGGGWTTRVARLGDDATPPAVGVPRPSFVSGSTAGTISVPLTISWSVVDPGSGVAWRRLERRVDTGAWSTVTVASSAASSVTLTFAYGHRYAFRLIARDNAGNQTDPAIDAVTGPSFTPTLYSQGSRLVAYRGTWATSVSSRFLGGSDRYTGTARKSATLTLSGIGAAWITVSGPTRGTARISVDGGTASSYSLYRASATYRRVIAPRTFVTGGLHTYRVEVAGTAGHPRIDVDGFIVLR